MAVAVEAVGTVEPADGQRDPFKNSEIVTEIPKRSHPLSSALARLRYNPLKIGWLDYGLMIALPFALKNLP